MIKVFEGWNERVKLVVNGHKEPGEGELLVFEAKEGWKPLCEFLGKPILDELFPNVNDTASMKRTLKMIYVVGFGILSLSGIAVAGGFRLARQYLT